MVAKLKMLLPLLSLFVGFALGQQCPTNISPCQCSPPSGSLRGFILSCNSPNVANELTNSRLTAILVSYLSAGITSLSVVSIYGATSLTELSPQFSRFSNMENIEIYSSAILSIPADSFNFVSTGSNLQIRYNDALVSIGAGAFKGVFSGVNTILVDANRLTRFDENVFQSLVTSPLNSGSSTGDLFVTGNPIDCGTDKCHLAWVIRDLPASNTRYRNVFGTCSNGTSFSSLIPRAYQDCPTNLFTCPTSNGLFANPENPCGEVFYQCSAGYAYFQYCPTGLVFNPRNGYCDYPFNVAGC